MSVWHSAVVVAAIAGSADLPLATAPTDARCYATVDDAAIEALTLAMSLPSTVEHGGAIYQRGNSCFVFSMPVTIGKPLRLKFRVRTSTASQLAGIYHTHTGRSGAADAFSRDDVLQSRASKVPSFVGVHGFDHIRKLRSGYVDYSGADLANRLTLQRLGVKGIILAGLASAPTATPALPASASPLQPELLAAHRPGWTTAQTDTTRRTAVAEAETAAPEMAVADPVGAT